MNQNRVHDAVDIVRSKVWASANHNVALPLDRDFLLFGEPLQRLFVHTFNFARVNSDDAVRRFDAVPNSPVDFKWRNCTAEPNHLKPDRFNFAPRVFRFLQNPENWRENIGVEHGLNLEVTNSLLYQATLPKQNTVKGRARRVHVVGTQ